VADVEGSKRESGVNVMNGPEEASDQARMDLPDDGLPEFELSVRDRAAFVEAVLKQRW
jgi:hypothetical protein